VTLIFKDKIKAGNYNLTLSFKGIINEGLRGFYRSKYILDGETKHLATTQFEATDARRAFPCFDEPEQKAVFEVSLIIADKHTAISNTLPVEIKEHSAGYKIVSFAPTPRMSTYLLAFIIGEFEYVEGWTKEKVQVRVFTTAGKSHQAKFALEVAIKSLEFYNEYFDIPYPIPTLDLIAIPDFESAAMENWGAVTFRETAILVDEENTSLSNKQWVAIVIAHELSHQWFGNLVTMKWWTDLWLNEGFATYMETFCVDKMFPSWHMWDLYLADRYALALRLDSLSNSHPIEIEVNHPDEINEIFDMVSYAKGGAMIRQLAEYIGDDKFRDGLRHYLKKHSYKNTNTVNLWESFEKVSKKPISGMMSAWTKETGYPLVTTFKKENEFYLLQERFFSSRIEAFKYKNSNIKKNVWPIPFKYESRTRAGTNEVMKLLMTKKSIPLIGTSIGKVNKEENTMMRVRYDNETLKKLSDEIIKGTLSVKDRLGIIRDLFALAEGGYITTNIALEFALNYKGETEYIVWAEIVGGINRVYNLISSELIADKYKKYVCSLFSPLAEKMGWKHTEGE
jgi:aminopeptidase N